MIWKIGRPGATALFCKRSGKKDGLVWLTPCDNFFCKWSDKKDSLVRQFFFANFPEHLYVLGSCKKGALVQQLLLQIMISIKMGQPHVMQLPMVLFLQISSGWAGRLQKERFAWTIFLYSDRICKICWGTCCLEEEIEWQALTHKGRKHPWSLKVLRFYCSSRFSIPKLQTA